MDEEDPLHQAKTNKKLGLSVRLKPSCRKALENELWEALCKLEHRAEILIAISHDQRTSGWYELAEAYKKQSMNSKAKAQSIRKLLVDLA